MDESTITAFESVVAALALKAARERRAIYGFTELVTPGAAQQVRTDSTLVWNIQDHTRVIIVQINYLVATVSDNCEFQLGYTDAANGGGNFNRIGRAYYYYTPAAMDGHDAVVTLVPPHIVRWRDGPRSITIRVDANDATCQIVCGWRGWWEPE